MYGLIVIYKSTMTISKIQFIMILSLITASVSIFHEDITCEESIVKFKGYKCLDTGTKYFTSNQNSITFRITDARSENTYLLKIKNKLIYIDPKKEIELLAKCKGLSNVIQIFDSHEDSEYNKIITNFGERGNLRDYIKNTRFKNATEAMKMFEKIVTGIRNIHSKGIVHGNTSLSHLLWMLMIIHIS